MTLALESLKSLHFDWFLLCKVYNVWSEKVWRVIFHETEEWSKNWLVVWKITWGIWQIFTRALESFRTGTLMGSFCPKQKMYEFKIFRGVMCHDIEEWWKIWRGIDMLFQKWQEEFDKFWLEQSKVSKICTLRRDQVNLLVYGPDRLYFKQKQKITLQNFCQLAFSKSIIFCFLIKIIRNKT